MKHYGQYCPVARTSELLAERWTPIIIRNLLAGCHTFGDLLDGAPGISRALLVQRLRALEDAGIIASEPGERRRAREYHLTPKGRDLKTVTDAMGAWGARWLELQPHDLDPAYVLWATCRLVDLERVPEPGFVVRFELGDGSPSRLWMLVRRPAVELCSAFPGSQEDLVVHTDSETLARWHLRHVSYGEAVATGRIRIDGAPRIAAAFVGAIRPSPFAR